MRLVRFPGVFAPISDSWMLAAELRRAAPAGRSVLDLCTGSGVLAVTAAVEGATPVAAVDVSRLALLSVRMNAAVNAVRVEARRGDLFAAVPGRRFDLIVSNPPYVPGPGLPQRGLARAWEGGPDGRAFIDRICAGAAVHLTPAGAVLLVHSTLCGEQATLDALQAGGLDAEVVFRHRGGLGPRMRERAEWLQERGVLREEQDEVLIIRGQRQQKGGERQPR